MKFSVLICARGGSKGIPKKNLQVIGPWRLLEWSIRFSMLLTEKANIFVSSDNDEFLEIASSFGVHAIKRPTYLSTDNSPEDDTWKYMIPKMRSFDSYKFCIVLPCTSPFRSLKYFSDIASFFQKGSFFHASATKARRNPWFNMVQPVSKNSSLYRIVNSQSNSEPVSRRQDAPQVFDLTTTYFVFDIDNFLISTFPLSHSFFCLLCF